jgi:hypothetical protein
MTPTRIVPGMANLAEQQKALKPLRAEATDLNKQLNALMPAFEEAQHDLPGFKEVAGKRAKTRIAIRSTRNTLQAAAADSPQKPGLQVQLGALTNQLAQLDSELASVTSGKPAAKKTLLDREKILGQLAVNREKQEPFDTAIKARGNSIQFYQEMGGLVGRIALALLIAAALPRRLLLQLFLVPGVIVFPITYFYLYRFHPDWFPWGIAAAGFLTVAQFSYFGEYLPKVFPLHLRGTGGGFATNVGGRMFGTSAAFITANLLAPLFQGTTFAQVATAAGFVGTSVFLIALALSSILPEPKPDALVE